MDVLRLYLRVRATQRHLRRVRRLVALHLRMRGSVGVGVGVGMRVGPAAVVVVRLVWALNVAEGGGGERLLV